jgi:intracellular sulfur oxidation DsrE/DsrF family protein
MNKFEEAIQIAKGVTNFLRMKANIANNDIEELHKEGMQYARCASLEIR